MAGSRSRRVRLALLIAALVTTAAVAAVPARAAAPPIRHVWVINEENAQICVNPTNEADPRRTSDTGCPIANQAAVAPYLGQVLPQEGTLVENYFGIGHESMDNYIAEVSGQAPNPDTQDDCAAPGDVTPGAPGPQGQVIGQGCTYPLGTQTIADQLQQNHMTWKGYMEDMGRVSAKDGTGCSTSNYYAGNTAYVAKHNPFVWFHSILDNPANPPDYCATHVVSLDRLRSDLSRIDTTPNLAFITPNMSDDGHDWHMPTVSGWAAYWVRQIMASPAYRQDGLIIVVWDENEDANSVSVPGHALILNSCCGEVLGPNSPLPGGASGVGGGETGAWIVSSDVTPGTLAATDPVTTPAFKAYNHYSLLRTLEDIFGITRGGADGKGHLGYAAGNVPPPGDETANAQVGLQSFGCGRDDIFTATCPPMEGHVPAPAPPSTPGPVGPRTADGSVRWLNPAPQGNDLNGVSCAGPQQCVAVGAAGAVVSTSNGSSWVLRQSGTTALLKGVSCPHDSQLCVAVGSGGTILRSTDGGSSWSAAASGTTHDLSGVSCPSSSACFAVGAGGTVLATSDAGASWTAESSHTSRDLFAIACPSAQTCFATGGAVVTGTSVTGSPAFSGDLLITRDGGATWSTVNPAASGGSYRAIACSDNQHCVLSGELDSFPYMTSDGGMSITKGPSDIGGQLLGGSCGGSGFSCVLVGGFGSFIRVVDGAEKPAPPAKPTPLPSGIDLAGASCPTPTDCYAVGRDGAVLASTDGGATWARQGADRLSSNVRTRIGQAGGDSTPIGSLDMAGVSCATPPACIAVGSLGAVVATGDTGASWAPRGGLGAPGGNPFNQPLAHVDSGHLVASPIPECDAQTTDPLLSSDTCTQNQLGRYFPLGAVSCARPSTCVAVGELGKVARTSDLDHGGGTWTVQSLRNEQGLKDRTITTLTGVSCPSGSTVCVAVGDYGLIVRSTDDGASWTAPAQPTKAFLNSVSCPDVSHCVAVGVQGTILVTGDGANWSTVTSPTSAYLSSVSCPSTSSCLAVGEAGTVLASDDGGHTWSARTAPSGDDLYAASCPTASRCVATGSAGTVATTSDAGNSWHLQGTGTTDTIRSVNCPSSGHCLAAGDNGALLAITPHQPGGGNGGGLGSLLPSVGSPAPSLGCGRGSAPKSTILRRTIRRSHRRVSFSGRSLAQRCARSAAANRIVRVEVAVGRVDRHGCRFLKASGRLSTPRSCRRPIFLRVKIRAKGLTAAWKFRSRSPLPPGSYRLLVRSRDRSGKLERPGRAVSVRVR